MSNLKIFDREKFIMFKMCQWQKKRKIRKNIDWVCVGVFVCVQYEKECVCVLYMYIEYCGSV